MANLPPGLFGVSINETRAYQTPVRGGGGREPVINGQGKMNFGQGKVSEVREFHFRLVVGTLNL